MRLSTPALLLAALCAAAPARAQEPTVGLAVPLSGGGALLGEQFADGARTAAAADGGVRLAEADDDCSAEGGAAAARTLVEAGASVVIGFLCTPAVEAALPILAEAGVPAVTMARTGSLTDQRERTGWPVYRLAPRVEDEREAVGDILVRRWRDAFFAVVDDGTIYGRELAEHFRAAAEMAELRPVFFDTFRPQLENQIGLMGRLRRAGATHVFVGGDRADIAVMARDAAELGYEVTLAGGEALRDDDGPVPLRAGVMMVGLPRWQDHAPPAALAALEAADVVPEGYVLPGYAALELAAGAARVAAEDEVAVEEVLNENAFQTALGAIRFDAKGDLTHNPYRLFRYNGAQFVEVE